MLKYKLSDSVYYTDTDSIFTSEKLDSSLIGPELGMVKDEITVNDGSIPLMNGPIKEAYFLGIKQYGYWYLNSEGRRIEKSVWAMRHDHSCERSMYNKAGLCLNIGSIWIVR